MIQQSLPGILPSSVMIPVEVAGADGRPKLNEEGQAIFAKTGRGKSLALWAHAEETIYTVRDGGYRARVLLYCALDRLRDVPPDAIMLDAVDPGAWESDPLYVVVRPGYDPDTGRPRVTVRDLLGMVPHDGWPTVVYIDEMGDALDALGKDATGRRALAELNAIAVAGRGGHAGIGVGPVIFRIASQVPRQIPTTIRSVALHWQFFGPFDEDAGAGIPRQAIALPASSPVGAFYSAATKQVVQLPTTYDRDLIRATHGADWGGRRSEGGAK